MSNKQKSEGGKQMLFVLTSCIRILPWKSRWLTGLDLRYAPES
jgi:hypothetical protein